MRSVSKIVFSIFILTAGSISASLNDSTAVNIITSLIWERSKLENFVSHDELILSKRLGITYKGIDNKCFISNDISPNIIQEIKDNKVTYTHSIEKLDGTYSKLIITVPSYNFTREYYFKDSMVVSKPYYYTKDWDTIKSKYFVFHVSDDNLLNNYSINKLDDFVKECSGLLNFTSKDLQILEQNKIHYLLCKDENEIQLVTGFDTRGLYYIPYDYVISTFNYHTHELLHLLMNFKLKNLPLYTLPFFQEGFAVAFGGRGGQDQSILLNMGLFLEKSGFLTYSSLLNKPDFYKNDITMSYPVAGLYNKFLFERLGADAYLKLYMKYSSNENEADRIKIDLHDLPDDSVWQGYLKDISGQLQRITTPGNINNNKLIQQSSSCAIYDSEGYYQLKLPFPSIKAKNSKSIFQAGSTVQKNI